MEGPQSRTQQVGRCALWERIVACQDQLLRRAGGWPNGSLLKAANGVRACGSKASILWLSGLEIQSMVSTKDMRSRFI